MREYERRRIAQLLDRAAAEIEGQARSRARHPSQLARAAAGATLNWSFRGNELLAVLERNGLVVSRKDAQPGPGALGVRYLVTYGDLHGSAYDYCVWDQTEKLIVAANNSKNVVIKRAQELNGFEPADGSEETYAKQTRGIK